VAAPKRRLEDLPLVEPSSRSEWRGWLAENHATSSGIWLAVGKKGNRVTTLTYNDAVEEALCFGWIDSIVHAMDADRFRQLFTPRKPGSVWSKSNKARIERIVAAGLMQPSGQAVIDRAVADGSWRLLDEVEALVVPDDLSAALETAGATGCWEGLTPGTRKLALYWIASAKRLETRANRIAQTVSAALEGRGPR
jgi:uncharacterized protein YdeI (YjbR/CyaY-like superfamily)